MQAVDTNVPNLSFDIDPIFKETMPGFSFDAANYVAFCLSQGLRRERIEALHVSFQENPKPFVLEPDAHFLSEETRQLGNYYYDDNSGLAVIRVYRPETAISKPQLAAWRRDSMRALSMSRTLLHETGHFVDDMGGERYRRITCATKSEAMLRLTGVLKRNVRLNRVIDRVDPIERYARAFQSRYDGYRFVHSKLLD